MIFFLLPFLYLACGLVISQTYPSTLPFTIRLRDQTFENRQFETYNGAGGNYVTNICEQHLYGPNADMIYVPEPLRNATQNCSPLYNSCRNITVNNYGSLFFNDYYHDTPGLNFAYDTTLTFNLINPTTGVYQYYSTGFFPLNNIGFIREDWLLSGAYYNFGFSSELRVPFYYRGGETFSFTGDDDIWIYIDNLLACDLGGIHAALSCSFSLDHLGLTINTSHTLSVFHVERHITGSNYQVTTSILPADQPPKIANTSYSFYEDHNITISLTSSIADADSTVLFYYIISPAPTNGTLLNATTLQPIKVPSPLISLTQSFIYVPKHNFFGKDVIYIVANDLQLNSTVGQVTLNVVPVNDPPVMPVFTEFQLDVGETLNLTITAIDVDSQPSTLIYTITSQLQCGNGKIYNDPINGTIFEYVAILPGTEMVILQVSDTYGSSLTMFTIVVNAAAYVPAPTSNSNQSLTVTGNSVTGLSMNGLIGIIVGGIALIIILGAILIFIIYTRYASKKLENQWEHEFNSKSVYNNPLYSARVGYMSNPVFLAHSNG